MFFKIFFLFINFRERERKGGKEGGREKMRDREEHHFVVPLTDVFIGSFLYVP